MHYPLLFRLCLVSARYLLPINAPSNGRGNWGHQWVFWPEHQLQCSVRYNPAECSGQSSHVWVFCVPTALLSLGYQLHRAWPQVLCGTESLSLPPQRMGYIDFKDIQPICFTSQSSVCYHVVAKIEAAGNVMSDISFHCSYCISAMQQVICNDTFACRWKVSEDFDSLMKKCRILMPNLYSHQRFSLQNVIDLHIYMHHSNRTTQSPGAPEKSTLYILTAIPPRFSGLHHSGGERVGGPGQAGDSDFQEEEEAEGAAGARGGRGAGWRISGPCRYRLHDARLPGMDGRRGVECGTGLGVRSIAEIWRMEWREGSCLFLGTLRDFASQDWQLRWWYVWEGFNVAFLGYDAVVLWDRKLWVRCPLCRCQLMWYKGRTYLLSLKIALPFLDDIDRCSVSENRPKVTCAEASNIGVLWSGRLIPNRECQLFLPCRVPMAKLSP